MPSLVSPQRVKGYSKDQRSPAGSDLANTKLVAQFCIYLAPMPRLPSAIERTDLQDHTYRLAVLEYMLSEATPPS